MHSGARMGQDEVPGHVQAGGDERAKGKDGGLEEDGPKTSKSICERILTVPSTKLVRGLHRTAKGVNDRRINARIALSLARISQLKERARGDPQVSQFLKNG